VKGAKLHDLLGNSALLIAFPLTKSHWHMGFGKYMKKKKEKNNSAFQKEKKKPHRVLK
jgi:hypothetical protein